MSCSDLASGASLPSQGGGGSLPSKQRRLLLILSSGRVGAADEAPASRTSESEFKSCTDCRHSLLLQPKVWKFWCFFFMCGCRVKKLGSSSCWGVPNRPNTLLATKTCFTLGRSQYLINLIVSNCIGLRFWTYTFDVW